jgi:Holliday junction DNA helicase RuvA
MFYYIAGTLAHKEDGFAVIDAGGVGYKLLTSLSSLDRLGAVGSDAKMYTYLYVREGIFDLYGFASEEELNMFLLLTGVSGVGPKAALAVLSVMSTSALSLAVVSGDTKSITRANGVGPKVAQRIVMELKDKIKNEDLIAMDTAGETAGGGAFLPVNEAVEALCVLGYSAFEAKQALSGIDLSQDLELVIRDALKKLMK